VASHLRFVNPPTIAKPPGYSHVVEIVGPGRIVYIAGQLGTDINGKFPPDFRSQAVQAFENLKAALEAVGARFEHVVKINNFIVDIATNLPAFREARDRYINTASPPASTTIEVPKLAREGALFEVEAVAVLPA
jgi:enamine deaminase RidA (YjgF/YER057c/UK114 family)